MELESPDPVIVGALAPEGIPVVDISFDDGSLHHLLMKGSYCVVLGKKSIRFPGLHVHHAQTKVFVHISAESCSEEDGYCISILVQSNSPGKERTHGRNPEIVKNITIFKEKESFLGQLNIKQGKVDHLLVHLHLGEIRINGEIQVEAGGDWYLGIYSCLVYIVHRGSGLIVFSNSAPGIGDNGQISRCFFGTLIPGQRSGITQFAFKKFDRYWGPGMDAVGCCIVPEKINAPAAFVLIKPEGFERNGYLRNPSVGRGRYFS